MCYNLFQKRFILVLFHERFKLPSSHHWNFWLRIKLSFQNSDLWAKILPPSWNFQWSRGEHGYFLKPQIWGRCAFIVAWEPMSHKLPHDMTPAWAAAKETTWQLLLLFPFLILSLIFFFLHISSPHPKDNYSVGCIFLIRQFALSGPLHTRVFTMCKNNTSTGPAQPEFFCRVICRKA